MMDLMGDEASADSTPVMLPPGAAAAAAPPGAPLLVLVPVPRPIFPECRPEIGLGFRAAGTLVGIGGMNG